MAPPIPEHMKRFTANPAKPQRYRPGKAVEEAESSEDEEEEEEEEKQPRRSAQRPVTTAKSRQPVQRASEDEDEDEDGFVTEDEDAPAVTRQTSSKPIQRPQVVARPVTNIPQPKQESDQSVEESEEEDSDESSEEESSVEESSEEEAPARKFVRPTFISKAQREANTAHSVEPAATTLESVHPSARTTATPAPISAASHYDESTTDRRRAEAEDLIALQIQRDTQARLAGKKNWDDDDDLLPEAQVDDTDDLDPDAEHLAWRLRELKRLKRDREAMIAREKEIEEVERRRNLSTAEREAEDAAHLAAQASEKEGRGQAGYLSKYHHRGAFFMDDADSERLAKRDVLGARFVDDVVDKSALPSYLQVRDVTKIGKKGNSRKRDLRGDDTGRFGDEVKRWKGSGYSDNHYGLGRGKEYDDVDERFRPDDGRVGAFGGSGANASALGERREYRRSRSPERKHAPPADGYDRNRIRERSRDRQDRSRHDRRDRDHEYESRTRSRSRENYKHRRRRSYSRSPSRSRTPERRKRRSPPPHRDKRARLEV